MRFQVYWTPRAKNNLNSIKTYLTQEWNQSVSVGFENKVKDFTEILKKKVPSFVCSCNKVNISA